MQNADLFEEVDVFVHDGWKTGHYFASTPASVPPSGGWPVLLFLQGTREMTCTEYATRLDVFSEDVRHKFIIVSPYAPTGNSAALVEEPSSWGMRVSRFNEDAAFYLFEHAIFKLKHTRGNDFVDVTKLFVTGYSLGADAVWNLSAKYGRFFAAVSPLACCGDEDVICTVQSMRNFSGLPIRAFQSATERENWKCNKTMRWLGSRVAGEWQPESRSVHVDANPVEITRFAPNQELWEIQQRPEGEPRNWQRYDARDHDVWTTVYGNEHSYNLMDWLLSFSKPTGLVNELALDFTLSLGARGLPCECSCLESCPLKRSGVWCGEKDGKLVVGTFNEWEVANDAILDKDLNEPDPDGRPRVGVVIQHVNEKSDLADMKWMLCSAPDHKLRVSIQRPFGLCCLPATASPRITCKQCGRTEVSGWNSLAGDPASAYCAACWRAWDFSLRMQNAKRELQSHFERGDFAWEITQQGELRRWDETLGREEWFRKPLHIRTTCTKIVAQEFRRLYNLVQKRSCEICSVSELAGQVLLWHHDGVRCNGTLELCFDSSVRWSGNANHGSWSADGDKCLTVHFGNPIVKHTLTLQQDGKRLMLEQPIRSQASMAERPVKLLSPQQQEKLDGLAEQVSYDAPAALLELQKLAADVLSVEAEWHWRNKVFRYLQSQDGWVAMNDLNKDLKLVQPGEIASKKRLGSFKGVVAFTHNKRGQTYVRLRSIEIDMELHSASPGAGRRFMGAHFRKRIVTKVLGFLDVGCRAATYRIVRQALIPDVVSQGKPARCTRGSEFLAPADRSLGESFRRCVVREPAWPQPACLADVWKCGCSIPQGHTSTSWPSISS